MVDEKRIEAMSRELAGVRSRMKELGPIAVGTLARSGKKYRTAVRGRQQGAARLHWARRAVYEGLRGDSRRRGMRPEFVQARGDGVEGQGNRHLVVEDTGGRAAARHGGVRKPCAGEARPRAEGRVRREAEADGASMDPMDAQHGTTAWELIRHLRSGGKVPNEFNAVVEQTPPYAFATQCQAELFWSSMEDWETIARRARMRARPER